MMWIAGALMVAAVVIILVLAFDRTRLASKASAREKEVETLKRQLSIAQETIGGWGARDATLDELERMYDTHPDPSP